MLKRDAGSVNAVPSKRLFLSIIADYDLNRSICELVDNGLDEWTRNDRKSDIEIDVWLNKDQQNILVIDNAGGLARKDLGFVVGPGQSGSSSTDETIGIFGVGTKRAVVALAEDIRIRTRHGDAGTFQIEFDETWLEDDNWELPVFEVDEIPPGVTQVELQKLRMILTDEVEEQLRTHLGATYGKFITMPNVTIRLNGISVEPRFFDKWSYPPEYEPRHYTGKLRTPKGRFLEIDVLAGLSNESSPAAGEYGVYFYCNDRLVAPAMKSFDVGFTKGQAGLPHPKVSLTKVIVSIRGDASEMPWNSSKSDISTKHHAFVAIHDWLVEVVRRYATLSRIWMGEWTEKVFPYDTGKIVPVAIDDFLTAKKAFLPDPPKSRPRYADRVASANQSVAKSKPYVVGLFEGVIAANAVAKQPLAQRNWLAFNLLDLTITSSLKEYLVHEIDDDLTNKDLEDLLQRTRTVSADLKRAITLPEQLWDQIDRFSKMRTELAYARTIPNVTDVVLTDLEETVQELLLHLFELKLSA